jgi:type IV pilus assembly protein PilA
MGSFCAGCGNSMTAGDRFCRVCGREVSAIAPPTTSSPGVMPPSRAPAETSGKAIVSLICGLLFYVLPFSIVAIIFGHLSLSDIRKSAGRLTGEGIAIAGLVLGYVGIAAIPVILIIAAIAIPNLLRARMAANEASAVASVRTVVTAESAYAESHHDVGYTCSLPDLAEAQFIAGDLASGTQHGYKFELSGCSANAGGWANVKYHVVAYPVKANNTGVRAFCSDESGVVKTDAEGSPQDCLEKGTTLE